MARRASSDTVMPLDAPDAAAVGCTEGAVRRRGAALSAGGVASDVRPDPVVRGVAMITPVFMVRFERAESLQAARRPCKPGQKRDRSVRAKCPLSGRRTLARAR